MSSPDSLHTRVSNFDQRISRDLATELTAFLNGDPDGFAKFLKETGPPLEIAITGLEDGTDYLFLRRYDVTVLAGTANINIGFSKECPEDCSGKIKWAPLGVHDVISKEVANNTATWDDPKGIAEVIRTLITHQISATPDKVGPPVSLVEMRKGTVNWIEKGVCK